MSVKGVKIRIVPPSAGLATAFSMLGFVFIAAGSFLAYAMLRNLVIHRAGFVFAAVFLAFCAFLCLIGAWSMKSSQKNARDRMAYESESTTTTARVVDRGRKKETDEYGGQYYTYWVSVEFRPVQARSKTKDLTLRATVGKRLHDRLQPGSSLRVRYANSNPRMALLEGETKHVERSVNAAVFLPSWILANVVGGVVGFYIGEMLGGGDPILVGAIAGLVIASAQWLVMFRYIPIPNWQWVAASILGWAIFVVFSHLLLGLAGGIALGVLQWLVLHRKLRGTVWWVLVTSIGMVVGQGLFNILAPSASATVAGAIFDLVYGGATGIALYIIAGRSLEAPAYRRPKLAERPTEPAPEMIPPSSGGLGIFPEEMELVRNGKSVSRMPDEDIIRETLEGLFNQGEGYAILGSGNTYVQTAYESDGAFILEYQGGSLDEHYACVSDFGLADVISAFTMFLNADDRLMTEFSWEWMAL